MTSRTICLRAIHIIAAPLILSLTTGCIRHRGGVSLVTPQTPAREKRGVTPPTATAPRAPDSTRAEAKPGGKEPGRTVPSGGATKRPTDAMGTGTPEATSTAGVVPPRSASGGWSSVVTTDPATAADANGNSQQNAGTFADRDRPATRTAVRATVLAVCLVGAILWLPRWLDGRQPR